MKKLQLISITSYCSKSKAFDMRDILIETVQKEDLINHADTEVINIPKMVSPVTKFKIKEGAGLYSFLVSCLP